MKISFFEQGDKVRLQEVSFFRAYGCINL